MIKRVCDLCHEDINPLKFGDRQLKVKENFYSGWSNLDICGKCNDLIKDIIKARDEQEELLKYVQNDIKSNTNT